MLHDLTSMKAYTITVLDVQAGYKVDPRSILAQAQNSSNWKLAQDQVLVTHKRNSEPDPYMSLCDCKFTATSSTDRENRMLRDMARKVQGQ